MVLYTVSFFPHSIKSIHFIDASQMLLVGLSMAYKNRINNYLAQLVLILRTGEQEMVVYSLSYPILLESLILGGARKYIIVKILRKIKQITTTIGIASFHFQSQVNRSCELFCTNTKKLRKQNIILNYENIFYKQ